MLRSIPSGIFQDGKTNLIGNGVVLDPVLFREEAESLEKSGIPLRSILKISKKVHLIMPTHRLLDAANEKAKGISKIGTTGKGIGPTYTDKISRNGLRLGDTLLSDFRERYAKARDRHIDMLAALGEKPDTAELESKWMDAIEYIKTFDIVDSEFFINRAPRRRQKRIVRGSAGHTARR